MKICIDARSPYGGGITTYTQELLKNIMAVDKENEYIILYDSQHGRKGYINAYERIAPSSNIVWRLIWDHTYLPLLLKKEKVDIYHSFKHFSAFKSFTKLIYTVHSAGFDYLYPNLLKFTERFYLNSITKLMKKTATCFITLSKADKEYFARWSGVEREKIKTTYLGVDERFHEIKDESLKEKIRAKYKLPENFILFVGIIHPIKNIETLIRAYGLAHNDIKMEYKLVIVGRPGNQNDYYRQLLNIVKDLGIGDSVIFPGYIKEDLPVIYNMADLFVFPSFCENFPLPPLEAMACGTPVVASNVGGIPEIYEDAAILVDPSSVEGFAEAILRVLSSSQQRNHLRQKGLEKAEAFSWRRCALETLKIYEELFK